MSAMFSRFPAVVLLVLVALSGCTGDKAGGRLDKKAKGYGNVVSLSPSTTMLIGENGGISFLAGRTESCDKPSSVVSIPIVVKGTKPDYEAIMAQKPDLIVYDKVLYSDDEIAKIKGLGIELMEYDPHSIQDYIDYCYRYASKLGIEMSVSHYVDKVFAAAEVARSIETSKPKVTILLGDGAEGYLIMGTEMFHADLLKTAGGTPVGVEGPRFEPANIERLIEMNPDVIYSDDNAQNVYKDARLQTIAAVKNQRVIDVSAPYLVRMSSKIDDTIKEFSKDMRELTVNPRQGAK